MLLNAKNILTFQFEEHGVWDLVKGKNPNPFPTLILTICGCVHISLALKRGDTVIILGFCCSNYQIGYGSVNVFNLVA